jgi:hypothetical protein
VYEEFLKSLEVRKERNLAVTELVDGKFEDKFWMRDSVALKWLECLIAMVERPQRGPRKKKTKMADIFDGPESDGTQSSTGLRTPRSRTASAMNQSSPIQKPSDYQNGNKALSLKPTSELYLSGDETDGLIEEAEKCIINSKKNRKAQVDLMLNNGTFQIFPDDDHLIDLEIQRLKQRYSEEIAKNNSNNLKRGLIVKKEKQPKKQKIAA